MAKFLLNPCIASLISICTGREDQVSRDTCKMVVILNIMEWVKNLGGESPKAFVNFVDSL